MATQKMNLKTRSYILDEESVQLLKAYATNQKTSISAALRFLITSTLGGKTDAF